MQGRAQSLEKAQVKDKGLGSKSWDLELESQNSARILEKSGPRRARTVDPRIKSPLLYRLSYRPHLLASYD
jgi:hypothetical protein